MIIKVGDREIEVDPVDVVTESEPANEYFLGDGAVLRVKTAATAIFKARTEKDHDGNPAYIVRTQNITSLAKPPRS